MRAFMRLMFVFFLTAAFPHLAFAASLPTFSIIGISNRIEVTDDEGEAVGEFSIIADCLMDELLNSGRVVVYDTSPHIQKLIADEQSLPITDAQFLEAARGINTDYVIYGFVDVLGAESSIFGYMDRERGYRSEEGKIRAALSVAVVDTKTGKRVFTAVGDGESSAYLTDLRESGRMFSFGKETIPKECVYNALTKAVHKITDKILKAL